MKVFDKVDNQRDSFYKNNQINDCYPWIKCLARWGHRVAQSKTSLHYKLQKLSDCIIISSSASIIDIFAWLDQRPNIYLDMFQSRQVLCF